MFNAIINLHNQFTHMFTLKDQIAIICIVSFVIVAVPYYIASAVRNTIYGFKVLCDRAKPYGSTVKFINAYMERYHYTVVEKNGNTYYVKGDESLTYSQAVAKYATEEIFNR